MGCEPASVCATRGGPPIDEAAIEFVRGASEPLLAWLDEGLRGGRSGRLAAEYGLGSYLDGDNEHVTARLQGRQVAHALTRLVVVRAAGRRVPVGLIGLVYTDPAFRRRGLARQVIEAAARRLAARGARLAALWSDRHAYYGRLGFLSAGHERLHLLEASHVARAARTHPAPGPVGSPVAADWPLLEALYDAHPSRAERAPGALRTLAEGPDCRFLVSRRGGVPVAYAALGRGDDFPGVVHEWAGEPGGVLACLAAWLTEVPTLSLLLGMNDRPPARALREAGCQVHDGCLALVRLLRPAALWRDLVGDDAAGVRLCGPPEAPRLVGGFGTHRLESERALDLLLGQGPRGRLAGKLGRDASAELARHLPWPLFLWGFDSI